jgi:chorismate mutase
MSLLQPIRGLAPLDPASPTRVADATRRLCAAVLAHNRLRPGDVVAARFTSPASPLEAARAAGWTGIPLFFTRTDAPAVEVEAHVRLAKRRKLRPLVLEPEPAPAAPTAHERRPA